MKNPYGDYPRYVPPNELEELPLNIEAENPITGEKLFMTIPQSLEDYLNTLTPQQREAYTWDIMRKADRKKAEAAKTKNKKGFGKLFGKTN